MKAHVSAAFHGMATDAAAGIMQVNIGHEPRSNRHRIIPAVIGSVFAGLLLVGLGCTPFFNTSPQSSYAAETGTIVHARGEAKAAVNGSTVVAPATTAASAPAAAPASAAVADGTPTVATSSAPGGAVASSAQPAAASSRHTFSVVCDPDHASADPSVPRPETVALQGIMAGKNTKTALLNGVLYRVGDRFGSAACPWTIAMIEPASVRIEKAFGDRTCGVTIMLQNRVATTAKSR